MIEVSRNGRLSVIRINRPESAGALTAEMLDRLAEAVMSEGQDSAVNALVLTGTGRVFSAGADLAEVRAGRLATYPGWETLSAAVRECPLPVVAALNGTAAGGALGMVIAADMRIAALSARFFYPVMKMGVLPQPSDPTRLAALVGRSRAKMMLLGGVELDASTAEDWGLVDRIAEDPLAEALDLLGPATHAPRERVVALKVMTND